MDLWLRHHTFGLPDNGLCNLGGAQVPKGCEMPSNYHDTVQFSIVDDQGKAVFTVSVCACPDKVGWDDAQAPSKCPFNCDGAD